ncbi:serum amyloid P-component-like [Dendropsophus ebraccatus]|uniref:serum amyloid P-component-like n=1 Tax=Dendropsophus ebraccatus TaxID=150705 RepID=UPI00383132C3
MSDPPLEPGREISKDMEKMLFWMLLCISGLLGKEDVMEKLFAFPKESKTSHVWLYPKLPGPFVEATVCMRFHSDLTRNYSLFSLATQHKKNSLRLFYDPGSNQLLLSVINTPQSYNLQGNDFTEWTSICATWSSTAQAVWIDGKKYNKKGVKNVEISADPIIIIGQEQDAYGGGFQKSQSFVGEMTDVNMWDKALTDDNVIDYFAGNEVSGNIINWKDLHYNLTGDVTIRPYVDPYPCEPV